MTYAPALFLFTCLALVVAGVLAPGGWLNDLYDYINRNDRRKK